MNKSRRYFYMTLFVFMGILTCLCIMTMPAEAQKDASSEANLKTCKIGAVLPLAPTSPMPFTGEGVLRGLTIASMQAPEDFSVDLQLIVEDDRGEGKTTRTKAEKFFSMNDVPVVVTTFSHLSMPILPLAEKKKKVHFFTICGTPLSKGMGDWSFIHFINSVRSSEETARFARENLNAKTAACIALNVPTGHISNDAFKKKFTQMGGKVVDSKIVEMSQKDFRSMLLAIKKKNPDVIYLWAHGSAFSLLLKQIKETGIKSDIITMEAMNVPIFRKNAGSEGIEGVYFCMPSFDPDSKDPVVVRFVEDFKEKYDNKAPDYFSAFAYDIGRLLAYATSKGDGSPESIREELLKVKDFPGTLGPLTIDPYGNVLSGFTIMMIKDGKVAPSDK
ncbi:MAG: ABC transporter substrate-binding protein [Candidatus Aureabacteria bacterium]|nr:ABC transporter substrate-binding protein [Candidatus Auribacterota bacterium]